MEKERFRKSCTFAFSWKSPKAEQRTEEEEEEESVPDQFEAVKTELMELSETSVSANDTAGVSSVFPWKNIKKNTCS